MEKEIEQELQDILRPLHGKQIELVELTLKLIGDAYQKGIERGLKVR